MSGVNSYWTEKIMNGEAEYKTYAIGGSGVGTIPFGANVREMIVVDIFWSPFNDSINEIDQSDPAAVLQHLIHFLTLYNGKSKAIYPFRDMVWKDLAPNLEVERHLLQFQPNTILPAFYRSMQDIKVNIYNARDMENSIFTSEIIQSTTQEQNSPNGYGGIEAVTNIQFGLIRQAHVNSLGTFRRPAAATTGNQRRNEFYDLVNDETRLNVPSLDSQQYSFPLVTFGIINIFESPRKGF